jgi:hypothetical protein
MLQIHVESLLYELADEFLIVFCFEDKATTCASELYYLRIEGSIVNKEILHFKYEQVCLFDLSVRWRDVG